MKYIKHHIDHFVRAIFDYLAQEVIHALIDWVNSTTLFWS
jgi:hypothetical protein